MATNATGTTNKKCPVATQPSDQPKVCCVYVYNSDGTESNNDRLCVPISESEDNLPNTITSARCTSRTFYLYTDANGNPVQVPYGFINDCCYDCNTNKSALVLTKSGKLIRTGAALNQSVASIFERCCCNDGDDCACTKVPNCEQVRCAHRPDLSVDDRCTGRCTSYTYIQKATDPVSFAENVNQRKITCAFKYTCCGESNKDCATICSDGAVGRAAITTPAQKKWETMPCSNCGVCCPIVYGLDTNDPATYGKKIRYDTGKIHTDDEPPVLYTQETCEGIRNVASANQPLLRPYGEWHAGETDITICNPLCCKTVTRGDKTDAECEHMASASAECDPCLGRCTDLNVENNPQKCVQVRCATRSNCCGPNGDKCKPSCSAGAAFRWDPPTCPTDNKAADNCGVCCTIVYDTNNVATTARTCDSSFKTRSACEANNSQGKQIGEWKPFYTCSENPCATKICCKAITTNPLCRLQQAACQLVPQDEICACQGICTELTGDKKGETTCKDKISCCGKLGEKCRIGCNGEPALFAWNDCGQDECGSCCRNQPDGTQICDAALTKKECDSLDSTGARVGTWYPYETCQTVPCAKTVKCCDDTVGKGCSKVINCLSVPVANCENPCRDECYEIDETGAKIGDSFCATKVDCCGPANEKCGTLPGICPDTFTTPTYYRVAGCADPTICGICCQPSAIGDARCDTGNKTKTDCDAANGSWVPFGTCVDCNVIRKACVETTCLINGEKIPYASCQTVPPDKTNCKGICKELVNNYTTCKTKSECCGADGAKCDGGSCGAVITHTFTDSCGIDGEKCGVCCLINDFGRGPEPGPPEENIGRAACAAKGTANNGGLGNTTTWIPFGTAKDCTGKPCPTLCPDNKSVVCVTLTPPAVCPADPCAGKCTESDGTISVKTKKDCCVKNGINLCSSPPNPSCPTPPQWSPVCAANNKCGAVCKTVISGNTIVSSTCDPAITTYDDMLLAQAGAPAGTTYTWYPWDTCETVICKAQKCCTDICDDVKGCAEVDASKCKPCVGLCYDAIVSPTGEYVKDPKSKPECLTQVKCCGALNEKCSNVPSCPDAAAKVFEDCDTSCPTGVCLCNGGPVAETGRRVDYSGSGDTLQDDPFNVTKYVSCGVSFGPLTDFSLIGIARHFRGLSENFGLDLASAYMLAKDPCNPTDEELNQPNSVPLEWKSCWGTAQTRPIIWKFMSWRFESMYHYRIGDGWSANMGTALQRVSHIKIALYMCVGNKIVDVTDEIVKPLSGGFCVQGVGANAMGRSSSSFVGDFDDAARRVFKVDNILDRFECVKITTTGKYNANGKIYKIEHTPKDCAFLDYPCDMAPRSLDMTGCPQPFTENPLP